MGDGAITLWDVRKIMGEAYASGEKVD